MGTYEQFAAGQAEMNEADTYPEFARGQAHMHAAQVSPPAPKHYEDLGAAVHNAVAETDAKTDALRRGDYSPWNE